MNPSSSSNAEPVSPRVFHVQTRALSADLALADASESPHDLGAVDAARLQKMLEQLNALDSATVDAVDAHLVIKAPRGRLTLRPHARGCIVAPLEAHDAYVELPIAEAANYLAGAEPVFPAEPGALETAPLEGAAGQNRQGLAVLLFGLSAAVLATSAFFTFRSTSTDPDSAYAPLASLAQLDSLRAQATGRFATPYEDGGRTLEIRADGTLTWTEYGPKHEVTDQRVERYTFLLREGQPVLRAAQLGPISLPKPGTLFFAGETYTQELR